MITSFILTGSFLISLSAEPDELHGDVGLDVQLDDDVVRKYEFLPNWLEEDIEARLPGVDVHINGDFENILEIRVRYKTTYLVTEGDISWKSENVLPRHVIAPKGEFVDRLVDVAAAMIEEKFSEPPAVLEADSEMRSEALGNREPASEAPSEVREESQDSSGEQPRSRLPVALIGSGAASLALGTAALVTGGVFQGLSKHRTEFTTLDSGELRFEEVEPDIFNKPGPAIGLMVGGGALMGVGIALVTIGVIRNRNPQVALAPAPGGMVFSGRF